MIAVNCADCGKEYKISGTDFNEQKAAGTKFLCPVCRVKPVKPVKIVKSVEPKTEIKKISGKAKK